MCGLCSHGVRSDSRVGYDGEVDIALHSVAMSIHG